MAILQDQTKLPNGQDRPSYDDLLAMLQKQQEAILALQANRHQRGITFRVNDGPVTDKKTGKVTPGKRGLSILGLGQFPITAYASQWLRILDVADQLREFIDKNHSRLAWKDE